VPQSRGPLIAVALLVLFGVIGVAAFLTLGRKAPAVAAAGATIAAPEQPSAGPTATAPPAATLAPPPAATASATASAPVEDTVATAHPQVVALPTHAPTGHVATPPVGGPPVATAHAAPSGQGTKAIDLGY
jgi:hypothetical protein